MNARENVKDIVSNYLKENGFDGLCRRNSCGCGLDNLFDCPVERSEKCKPAYKHTSMKNVGLGKRNNQGQFEWYSEEKNG
jgi:hypothetical protein